MKYFHSRQVEGWAGAGGQHRRRFLGFSKMLLAMKIATARIWLLEFQRIGFEIEIFNTYAGGGGGDREWLKEGGGGIPVEYA